MDNKEQDKQFGEMIEIAKLTHAAVVDAAGDDKSYLSLALGVVGATLIASKLRLFEHEHRDMILQDAVDTINKIAIQADIKDEKNDI